MTRMEATVFIVDDDEAIRQSLTLLMKSVGIKANAYPSALEFLDAYDPTQPGCLVVDVRMPGMSGLDLQQHLANQRIAIPIIIITGHGDVPMAIRAMKRGAVDLIEKPVNDQLLLDRIRVCLEMDAEARSEKQLRVSVATRLQRLSPREWQVMEMMVVGKSSKDIAQALGISRKTVDVHRAHILEKAQVKSLAELVRMAIVAEVDDRQPARQRVLDGV